MEADKKMKIYSLDELKDKHLGKPGTDRRDQYEYELKMDLLGEIIRRTRKERHLTQAQLGELVGVQKSQISRIERNAKNVTIETILKVFKALRAKVHFNVELQDGDIKIA